MKDYRTWIWIIMSILLMCLIFLVAIIIKQKNNDVIKSGMMYYDLDNVSYEYNFSKNTNKQIEIQPYQAIRGYFPYKNGYFCIGIMKDTYGRLFPDATDNFDNEIERGDILYNDGSKTIVLSSEFSPTELVLVKEYVFFHTADDELVAIHIPTKERIVIDKQFFYYKVIGSLFVYSTYNEDKSSNIYYIDCEKSYEIKSEYVDEGIIKRTAISDLIYEKDKLLYHYSFTDGMSKRIDDYNFKKDSEFITYIGTFKYHNEDFDVFTNHPHFTDMKKADRMFNYGINYYFVPIYQQLIIQSKQNKMKLSLPRNKQVRVNALEIQSGIYYLNHNSLDYFGKY